MDDIPINIEKLCTDMRHEFLNFAVLRKRITIFFRLIRNVNPALKTICVSRRNTEHGIRNTKF